MLAGFASSFLGIGGGLIVVPLLASFFGFPLKRAIGTSLAAMVVVAAVGVGTESWVKGENIHWEAAAVLTLGSLAGSWVGALVVTRMQTAPLRWSLVALLLVASARLAGLQGFGSIAPPFAAWSEGIGPGILVGLGVVAGIASSLFGIGGGIVAVPGLSLLFRDFAFHGARATSLAMIVPTSLLGSILHRKLANVDGEAALALLATAMMGAVAGVLSANSLPEAPLRWSFALLLLFASWTLVRSGREE